MTFNRSWYATGAVSVNNASTAVTGVGSSWASFGIREGDYFFANGLMVPISAVGSNTGITLASGWPGTTTAGANYYIIPASDSVRTVVASRTVLDLMLNGNVAAEAGLTGAPDKISYFTGVGAKALADYKAPMRTLGAAVDMAALRTAAGLGSTDSPTFQGIAFPATQVVSGNANTLDDYEEGTWTPALSFATPGNLSVTYSSTFGTYTKVGRMISISLRINTSAFTFTTAASFFQVTGLPFGAAGTFVHCGACVLSGYTKAGADMLIFETGGSTGGTFFYILSGGSGLDYAELTTAHVTSGSAKNVFGSGVYNAIN